MAPRGRALALHAVPRLAVPFLAAALLAPGCYEIPPVIPPGYIGSPAAPGWPPLAVYGADPFHPRNRWFHRAFSRRTADGRLGGLHADAPTPALDGLTSVDRAEIAALLDRLGEPDPQAGGSPHPGSELHAGIVDLLFRSDALAAAAQAAACRRNEGDWSDVAGALARISMGPAVTSELLQAPLLRPPPLRAGDWQESAPPAAAELQPAPIDPRWTRLLHGPGGELTLLRLRVALDFRREPLLLDLPNECWRLGPSPGEAQLWLFDRSEWLHGRDPWRKVPGGTDVDERGRLLASLLRESGDSPVGAASQPDAVRAALAPLVR